MDSDRQWRDFKESGTYHGLIAAIGAGGLVYLAQGQGLPTVPKGGWVAPLAAVAGFLLGKLIGGGTVAVAGRAAGRIYAPTAAGTYAQTHSGIDALEAKGDLRGACDAWEALAVSQPDNPWPLIRAGELRARALNEPDVALERFKLARQLPGAKDELRRYASQKMIDLYLGPLADEGRALVELRRLIHEHPDTREAAGAREALARLKSARDD